MKLMFSIFGFCHALVSDNGPQFRSEEFEVFLRCNGINQMFSPAYHNGLAERGVRTVKLKIYLCKIWFSIFYLNIAWYLPKELILAYKAKTLLTYTSNNLVSNTTTPTYYKVKNYKKNMILLIVKNQSY